MDPVWATVINNGFLAVIAICTIAGTILAYRSSVTTAKTNEAVMKQSETITMLEVNTNSMKDALVASTDIGARAQGRAAGIAEERANPQVSSGKVDPAMPVVPPLPPVASPQVLVKEQGKKDVMAMNVRIIPDPVEPLPVKETK